MSLTDIETPEDAAPAPERETWETPTVARIRHADAEALYSIGDDGNGAITGS